ncbi:MAG: NADH-quinone oxidoreductase subunit NuoK [Chloroflexi bacterium]|nr:NADH-quinone oxidoreductase subunit NuoK [Chloroflexota bacterium]
MVPLEWYLVLAAALFCIGIYGVLSQRNAVAILMGVELMLNAVNINLVAFWRYTEPAGATGRAFALFVYAVAAAEVAVGLALIISVWRTRDTVVLDDVDLLKG